MGSNLREEEVINAAYEMASKMYNLYRRELKSVRVEKDDYMQDAVMYILNLYNKDYMQVDDDKDPKGIIFTMLKRFTKNQLQTNAKLKNRSQLTLDKPMSDEDGSSSPLELVPSEDEEPEEVAIAKENLLEGESILYDIIEELDVVPYKAIKHNYVGSHPILGSDLKLSEYNIGRLLLLGQNEYDILRIYNVYTNNIGTSSKATFVQRKVKKVIDKLADIVNSLSAEERQSVKEYLEKR